MFQAAQFPERSPLSKPAAVVALHPGDRARVRAPGERVPQKLDFFAFAEIGERQRGHLPGDPRHRIWITEVGEVELAAEPASLHHDTLLSPHRAKNGV